MLYLAIDLHSRQLTINLRDEDGTVLLQRQISTKWEKVRAFLAQIRDQAEPKGGFMTIVEVCGFEDWLLKLLAEYGCRQTVLVQSKERAKRKTDRIDAGKLGESLWLNRFRLANGERLTGLRHIQPPSEEDALARELTARRKNLGRDRTRLTNQMHYLLRKHNLEQDCPTKGIRTVAARDWLRALELPRLDRLAMNHLLEQTQLLEKQIAVVEKEIKATQLTHSKAALVRTIPGLAAYAALGVACRIGDIDRFPRGKSLGNFWGLTPSCRDSGETKRRLGSITKEGSSLVRFFLAQAVVHVLRECPKWRAWYRGIKNRRGSKIARVAVMRRLATAIWRMVKNNEPFDPNAGFAEPKRRPRPAASQAPPTPKPTADSAGEGTSRTPSSLPPHPQPPSPLPCSPRQRSGVRRPLVT